VPDSALPDTTVLTSSFYETYIRPQVVVTCTSATRPTGVEGRHIYETDTDLVYVHNGTGWEQVGGTGGWTSYTPTITQSGTVTATVTHSKWTRGPRRTITWSFTLTVTGSGTGSNVVTVSLPATAASTSSVYGAGYIYDASATTRYGGTWVANSTTTVAFVGDWAGANAFGVSPTTALASSDLLAGTITYEAAS
jgi:hypothetical protein